MPGSRFAGYYGFGLASFAFGGHFRWTHDPSRAAAGSRDWIAEPHAGQTRCSRSSRAFMGQTVTHSALGAFDVIAKSFNMDSLRRIAGLSIQERRCRASGDPLTPQSPAPRRSCSIW